MPLRGPGPTVDRVIDERVGMNTYVIRRRADWPTSEELREAAERSLEEERRMAEDVTWLRSYVVEEPDGSLGTVCIYEASGPEAIRRHARRAQMPVDRI